MSHLVPNRKFSKDHEGAITTVVVSPEGQRMVTGSYDRMLCLWDLKTGVMLKKMKGNRHEVRALAVSRDGRMIASGGDKGEIIIWHGETGEYLIQVMMADSYTIFSLDFSPDGTVLASGSMDWMSKFWNTTTWEMEGNPIESSTWVSCVRYSPSGKLLAIASNTHLKIYNSDTKECVADIGNSYKPNVGNDSNHFLAWTPDGTRLLSTGRHDQRIQEWDATTWKQVDDHGTGYCGRHIKDIAINPAGTLVASASVDEHVRLWRLSDRKTIAIFQNSAPTMSVTFSIDGMHILSGGRDKMISEWAVPEDANAMVCFYRSLTLVAQFKHASC
jgi:WD40 repeat protein